MKALSIKVKFTLIAVFIGLIGFGTAAFFSNEWMASAFGRHFREKAMLLRTQMVRDLETAMVSRKHEDIPRVLDTYRTYGSVKEVRIYNIKGQEVFTKDQGLPEERVQETLSTGEITSFDKMISGSRVTTYVVPIENKAQCSGCHSQTGRPIGTILLSFSLDEMNRDIGRQKRKFILLFAVLAILIGTATIVSVNRLFIQPLKRIQRAAEAVGKGEFEPEIPMTSRDEIGELTQTFHQMSARLKEAFESIKRSQEKIIQAEKLSSLGQLSAGLAHELKNPLTSIKMILQANLDASTPSEITKEDIEVILKEVKKLDTILTQFLTFARPPQLQLKPLDLRETVEEVLSLMKTEFDRGGVRISKEIPRNLPEISGDEKKIKQVLINLFLNAVQAMPEGGGLHITLEENVKNQRKEVLLRVQDSGNGIPEEHREKVFDPFFTTKEHGTGLGLSVVYSIIKEHHGTIDFQDRGGRGTTFRIAFPHGEGGNRNA